MSVDRYLSSQSGGIGSAIARALAAEGCDVALHCNANLGKIEALAAELQRAHPDQTFTCVPADLSSRDETKSLVDKILQEPKIAAKHKAISILVANAGLGRRIRDVKDIEEPDWDAIMEVNARSQFVVVKACLPGMRSQCWGRVILVGSISSKGGGINGCHYAASKGALRWVAWPLAFMAPAIFADASSSMGLNLATVLAGEGVTILPAMIGATDMIPTPKSRYRSALSFCAYLVADCSGQRQWTSDTNLEALKDTDPGLAIAASVPVRRLGQPQEVANVAVMSVQFPLSLLRYC
ncbi:Acetoacetyl-CoA reductase [Paramyrothecium foliicola]|nr:Acetoacetyl-CoA reductase [Paramyrothecium foliicola]